MFYSDEFAEFTWEMRINRDNFATFIYVKIDGKPSFRIIWNCVVQFVNICDILHVWDWAKYATSGDLLFATTPLASPSNSFEVFWSLNCSKHNRLLSKVSTFGPIRICRYCWQCHSIHSHLLFVDLKANTIKDEGSTVLKTVDTVYNVYNVYAIQTD